MEQQSRPRKFLSEEGMLDVGLLEDFARSVGLADGTPYAVVSILGIQSGGKSTLLNGSFNTNFTTMDSSQGISKTTNGMWIAKADVMDRLIIIMDLEGSDGKEKGEGGIDFERKSAVFAFAVSDIVIVNMDCRAIGLENAGCKPLIRTMFQDVAHQIGAHKTTLLFTLRDKNETPLSKLERTVKQDVRKMWDEIQRSNGRQDTSFDALFDVKVEALSNYEHRQQQFKEEVEELKTRVIEMISAGNTGKVPPSAFAQNLNILWTEIQENKDLNFPRYSKLVAGLRCDELVETIISLLMEDQQWEDLKSALESCATENFRAKLHSILDDFKDRYRRASNQYDSVVRDLHEARLHHRILKETKPYINSCLEKIASTNTEEFERQVNRLPPDSAKFQESLEHARSYADLRGEIFRAKCAVLVFEGAAWNTNIVQKQNNFRQELANKGEEILRNKQLIKVWLNDAASKISEEFERELREGPNISNGTIEEYVAKYLTKFQQKCQDLQIKEADLQPIQDDLETKLQEIGKRVLKRLRIRKVVIYVGAAVIVVGLVGGICYAVGPASILTFGTIICLALGRSAKMLAALISSPYVKEIVKIIMKAGILPFDPLSGHSTLCKAGCVHAVLLAAFGIILSGATGHQPENILCE